MSLFVAELALSEELITKAKLGVLIGSVISAIAGMALIVIIQKHGQE